MFTGIISKTSKVTEVKADKNGMFLEISNDFGKLKIGESISINGICSTLKKTGKKNVFEYMPETLRLTNLNTLKKNDLVNLETSLKFGDTLSGHIVLGHIDTKGKIIEIKKEGNSDMIKIKVPKKFMKFLVYKGSVALEGISLTVAKVFKDSFTVKIIPFTLKHTNLKLKKKGDLLNLEFDILAKYAKRR